MLAAQPTIDLLQNNYSYLLPSNPSYGIAQGSIFIIKGSNLANTSTSLQSAPLGAELEGVSAKVTVSGVTTDVIWYYVTPGQLGGILPSSTPVGDGTIVVTNNGQTSAPAPIKVVQSAFGVLTLDGSGTGAAAVLDVNYQLLSESNSAMPGDYIQFFGTGLGPVTGDETIQQVQMDLTNIPVSVEIGGLAANVVYRGRSQFPGLDQINVQVPDLSQALVTGSAVQRNAGFGCAIAVTVQIGAYESNATTIPVSATGGDCPPPSTGGGGDGGGSGEGTLTQEEINGWIAAGVVRAGGVTLNKSTSYNISDDPLGGGTTTMRTEADTVGATFYKITGDLSAFFNNPQNPIVNFEPGNCTVIVGSTTNPFPTVGFTSLDAGTPITVTGPNGRQDIMRQTQAGQFTYSLDVSENYLTPGQYTVSGPGGADVGSFNGTVQVATPLTWTNREALTEVNRNMPLTVTWDGGEPTSLVTIQGTSISADATGMSASGAAFLCFERNSAHSFTVPVDILQQLPASPVFSGGGISILQRGTLSISSDGKATRLDVDGLDYFNIANSWGVSQSTQYK